MIALDTNVIVRYLEEDDETQFRAVLALLSKKGERFYLCDLVLAEADWVLRKLYGWEPAEVAEAYARLTLIPNLVFDDETRLRASLKALREGADLADEFIARGTKAQGCRHLATFDKGIIRRHNPFAMPPS